MNYFIRRLPLLAKLMLIGIIPFCFLLYLTIHVYKEKGTRLKLFSNYKSYIAESATLNALIDALQEERKFSFDYVINKSMKQELQLQRIKTDSLLEVLIKSGDPAITGLTTYTKLGALATTRDQVDTFGIGPNEVMHYYSNTVFRLNTLNPLPPANTAYLETVYTDLVSHKILSEMITYLGIIRSNIYNVLHTRQYMIETLIGTLGTYDVYKSYEAELNAKAPHKILESYHALRGTTSLKRTTIYIDTVFSKFKFDDSFTAAEWWKVSDEGVNTLRVFQNSLWEELNQKLNSLYEQEQRAQVYTLTFLVIALLSVIAVVSYIMVIISKTLKELRIAAEKISHGESGVNIHVDSKDAIGGLAESILRIDANNQALAIAARAIGKGDFEVEVKPRGMKDVLGNAIMEMRKELQAYSEKMELLVEQRTLELARSNEDLQQFAHVASHDLKEPLRKIATFSNILNTEQNEALSEKGRHYLNKIEHASQRMSRMIEGVLAYSTINSAADDFQQVDLNDIIHEVISDLELAILQKAAKVKFENLPQVYGIRLLLFQLFYNLVNNALKFAKDNVPPEILIASKMEKDTKSSTYRNGNSGGYVHIIVQDNGIGFSPDYADRVFNFFSRLNPKNKYEGTGLGLALCRKIVQRHGGEIYAESEPDKGASFHIVLPAGPADLLEKN